LQGEVERMNALTTTEKLKLIYLAKLVLSMKPRLVHANITPSFIY